MNGAYAGTGPFPDGADRKKIQNIPLRIFGASVISVFSVLLARDYRAFSRPEALLGLLAVAGFCAYIWRLSVSPALFVDATGIEVKNPLRTHRIPWEKISHFWATECIMISLDNGSTIQSWAVVRTCIPGRRSRLDATVEELERIRQSLGGLPALPRVLST